VVSLHFRLPATSDGCCGWYCQQVTLIVTLHSRLLPTTGDYCGCCCCCVHPAVDQHSRLPRLLDTTGCGCCGQCCSRMHSAVAQRSRLPRLLATTDHGCFPPLGSGPTWAARRGLRFGRAGPLCVPGGEDGVNVSAHARLCKGKCVNSSMDAFCYAYGFSTCFSARCRWSRVHE